MTVRQAGPGILTYSGNRAVVQNQDYSLNSPTSPARVRDTVIAYLTGPGAVSPAVATGSAAPSDALSFVTARSSVTIGGIQAEVSLFGLTPGFVGLYQANLEVPTLVSGEYSLVTTVAGAASNGPLISIR